MRYDYNPEPDSGSSADRWVSLDSQIVEEMALILDEYLTHSGAVSMMRRKQEFFARLLREHPEIEKEEVSHYFWEGLRLQKNRFDWPEGHPMTQKKGGS